MLVVGSHALNAHATLMRRPKDLDVMGTPDELDKFIAFHHGNILSSVPSGEKKQHLRISGLGFVEFEICWSDSTAVEFVSLCQNNGANLRSIFIGGMAFAVPSVDELYTLKISHRFRRNSPHFQKTRRDLLFMKKHFGAKVPAYLEGWLKRRETETYTYKHPNLNQSKDGFFSGDGIAYVYDHDSIHASMAIEDVPAYTKFQKADADIAVDRNRWNALTEQQRLNSVIEESYVLALERSQIPFPGADPEKSFLTALQKVCTNVSSGWWREYAYNNYDAALNLYHETESRRGSYVEKFKTDVISGLVRPFQKASLGLLGVRNS